MITIRADDVIVGSDGRDGADGDCFFTDIEMEEPGDLGQSIHLRRSFLEPANQEHLTIEGEEVFSIHEGVLCRKPVGHSRTSAKVRAEL